MLLFQVVIFLSIAGSRLECIDVYVDAAILKEITTVLELSDEQANAARAWHADYWAAIEKVDAETRRERISIIERKRELTREGAPPDERALAHKRLVREQVRSLAEADVLLEEWLAVLSSTLSEPQQAEFARVGPLIRRRSRAMGATSPPGQDFRLERADLVAFVRDAMGAEGELGFLAEPIGEERKALRQELDATLLSYEFALDDLLRSAMASRRRASDKLTIEDLGRRWLRECMSLRQYVDQVADLLHRSSGPAASSMWRSRVYSRICPTLYAERWPERMVDWLQSRPDALPEQVEAAVAVRTEYLLAREAQRRLTVEAGLDAMSKHFPYAQGTASAQHRFVLKKHRLCQQTEQAMVAFRAILTPIQRMDLDGEVEMLNRHDSALFGESVHPSLLPNEKIPPSVLIRHPEAEHP